MELRKAYLRSLAILVCGLLLLVIVDYCLRFSPGLMPGLGMPEMVWFASQVIIAGISIFIFLLRTKSLGIGKKLNSS